MKKLSLGNDLSPAVAPASEHPLVQMNDEASALLAQFAQIEPQFKTFKNQRETLTKQLGGLIRSAFFGHYNGVGASSSTMLATVAGRTIKLIVKNAYSTKVDDEAPLVAALGQELVDRYFRQRTVLKLDLDKAPADKQEAFATAVVKLAREMGVTEAVSVSQCIQPVAGFHEARTSVLTTEQNVALDNVMPITAYPQL